MIAPTLSIIYVKLLSKAICGAPTNVPALIYVPTAEKSTSHVGM